MIPERVFQIKQAAEILNIPRTRLVNWMAGRTIRFKNLFRKAPGQGSPSLFSETDLNIVAIANWLLSAQQKGEIVQEVIDSAPDHWDKNKFLVIRYAMGKPHIEWTNSSKPTVAQFTLNLEEVRKEIDKAIKSYKG